MNLKALWWFHDLEGKLWCPRCDLESSDKLVIENWMCGLVGLGVLFDLRVYLLLPQRNKYFISQKQNKKINVNFAFFSKTETSEQLIHVPLLWQDLHKTPKPQPTFASGEHMMADFWFSCILIPVGLSLMPSARNCFPAFSVKLSYWWLLAFQGGHSFEMRLLVHWSSACYSNGASDCVLGKLPGCTLKVRVFLCHLFFLLKVVLELGCQGL